MQTITHDVLLTGPQEAFVFSDAKYPAIIGGYGSGKTGGGERRAIRLMLDEGGCDIGYYMPTYDLINLRAYPGFIQFCEQNELTYKTNYQKYWLSIEGLGRVIFRSYSRPERIIGYEVSHSIVDELDTLFKPDAAEVWRKVKERNRGPTKRGNTIANVTTPDQGFSGFSYSRWGKPSSDYELIKAPTRTNVFLDDVEDYIKQIREEYDPVIAQAYIDGDFVNLTQNKVYHTFDRTRHDTDREIQDKDELHISIDFNVGGCCATVSVIDGHCHVVDEFVSHETRDFVIRLSKYQGHKITVYPDASGQNASTNASASDIEIIRQAGFRVDAPKHNPFIKDRVNAVNGGFAHDRLRINVEKCPLLVEALESQGYDAKGKPEKYDDHPSIDDWADSFGYFYNRRFPVRKPAVVTQIGMSA